MTHIVDNDVYAGAFSLAILFALLMAGGLLALQGQPDTHVPMRLDEHVNPNTAPLASLLRLAGMGPARAQAIVRYRQAFVTDQPGQKPFQVAEDLTRIKGLGPHTVSAWEPWLKFDD